MIDPDDTAPRPPVDPSIAGPIRTEDELDRAIAIANRLAVRGDLTREEDAYLEELGDRIVAYEDIHYPISEE
ncbi:hypothetical protein [Singulisphaera sp. PoT]|uniref:hypothetical protein n=1 Tax=Singulisphaera sp. PoT TaxID=3411797 RepID=UPI003BF4E4C3